MEEKFKDIKMEFLENMLKNREEIKNRIIRIEDSNSVKDTVIWIYKYQDLYSFKPEPLRIMMKHEFDRHMLNDPILMDSLNIKWTNEMINYVIDTYNMMKKKEEISNMPIKNQFKLNWNDCIVGYDLAKPSAPKIKKIEVYNDRVVKITFEDGSFTKAVCSENDIFDVDVGITICIMKKMLGKDGNKIYNNMIREAHQIMNDQENEKIKEQMEREEASKKRKAAEMKRKAKKLKAKEEAIDIQKLAYIRAMQEMGMVNDGR